MSLVLTGVNTLNQQGDTIKGWIQFDGTGTIAITDSFNVSSITDDGTGKYTITWDTDFANNDYSITIGVGRGTSVVNRFASIYSVATGTVAIETCYISTTPVLADVPIICVIAIGDQ